MSAARLEAFSDGVFAVAITLLALDLRVAGPGHGNGTLAHQLAQEWPVFAAYVVSFFVIGIVWVNHHALFTSFARVDRTLMFLNLGLLLWIAAIPFGTSTMATYLRSGGGDAHLAFDSASAKMQKRIRRYKNRLKDHHPQALARQAETAAYYVLQAPDDAIDDDEFDGAAASFPEPLVIAETETQIGVMTVSMAVMELDLTESQTIVFRNAAHDGLSVVYRRPDGNIGWIDPERTRAHGDATGAA